MIFEQRHGLEFVTIKENAIELKYSMIDDVHEQVQSYKGNRDVVIDIGAHVGEFSCLMAQAGAKRVYAFEPMAANFHGLVVNVIQNRFWDIIKPFPFAVGPEHFQELSIGTSKSSAQNSFLYRKAFNRAKTITYSFRNILQQIEGIDYLKMDVEGAEFEIFKSVSDCDFKNVRYIDIEVHELTNKTYFDIQGSEGFLLNLQNMLASKGFNEDEVMQSSRWIRARNENAY